MLELSCNKDSQAIIVTNAKKSWVYICAEKMMPKTYKLILNKIPVVSARDTFVGANLLNAKEWKYKAFSELLNNSNPKFKFERDIVTNLIVIGDQFNEIQAGHDLSK